MADETVVHIGENSPERIAYMLMVDVMTAEKKTVDNSDRQLILDTYAECLAAAKGYRSVKT